MTTDEATATPPVTGGPRRPSGAWWAWQGVHGGSGATTLAQAVPGGIELDGQPADHGWPDLPVVAVARSHAGGIEAAQRHARWWAEHPGTPILGLVVVADAPGRLPRPLESMIRLASGGWPTVWRIPFVPAWRLGQTPTPANTPRACRSLLTDLLALAGVDFTTTEDIQ